MLYIFLFNWFFIPIKHYGIRFLSFAFYINNLFVFSAYIQNYQSQDYNLSLFNKNYDSKEIIFFKNLSKKQIIVFDNNSLYAKKQFEVISKDGDFFEFLANSYLFDLKNQFFLLNDRAKVVNKDYTLEGGIITYNKKTQEIFANKGYNILYSKKNILFKGNEFILNLKNKTTLMNKVEIFIDNKNLMWGESGGGDEEMYINNFEYTTCDCKKNPLWIIKGSQAKYNPETRMITLNNPTIELLGVELPSFISSLNILDPSIKRLEGFGYDAFMSYKDETGYALAMHYFIPLDTNEDLWFRLYAYTQDAPIVEAKHLQLFNNASFDSTLGIGYIESEILKRKTPAVYGFFKGYYQADDNNNYGYNIDFTSDRMLLKNYKIIRQQKIEDGDKNIYENANYDNYTTFMNSLNYQFIRNDEAVLINTLYTQNLQNRKVPNTTLLPEVDYYTYDKTNEHLSTHQRLNLTLLTNKQFDKYNNHPRNEMYLQKSAYSLKLEWLYWLDQGIKLTTQLNQLLAQYSPIGKTNYAPLYVNYLPTLSQTVSLPMVNATDTSLQYLEPIVQLTYTPNIKRKEDFNFDSKQLTLNETNLFTPNRFYGLDSSETGLYMNYGLKYSFKDTKWWLSNFIGQSLELTNNTLDYRGFTGNYSDVITTNNLKYKNSILIFNRLNINPRDAKMNLLENYLEITLTDSVKFAVQQEIIVVGSIDQMSEQKYYDRNNNLNFHQFYQLTSSHAIHLGTYIDLKNKNTTQAVEYSFRNDCFKANFGIAYNVKNDEFELNGFNANFILNA